VKSSWDRGEWDDEPDKIQWIDPVTDLDCLMVRNTTGGNWCGYVGVDKKHPLYEVGDSEAYGEHDLGCHGGLTFSGFCQETEDHSRHICHIPAKGRPDKVWWFGFDCAHAWDASPGREDIFKDWDKVYRNNSYVKMEVESLAKKLKELVV